MSVLYIAMPIALALAGLAVWAFVRSVRGGQFDDLDTPAVRMLGDDDAPTPPAACKAISTDPITSTASMQKTAR